MALITCQECKQSISNTAKSCPHCGFVFKESQLTHSEQSTMIFPLQKNIRLGIFQYIVGIALIPVALFGLFLFPIGLIGTFGAFVMMSGLFSLGYGNCVGQHEVICPYCRKPAKLFINAGQIKCKTCKKLSIRVGDNLKAIH